MPMTVWEEHEHQLPEHAYLNNNNVQEQQCLEQRAPLAVRSINKLNIRDHWLATKNYNIEKHISIIWWSGFNG